jgi:hypothetical protein
LGAEAPILIVCSAIDGKVNEIAPTATTANHAFLFFILNISWSPW